MPRDKTPEHKDNVRLRWAQRQYSCLPVADWQQVDESLLRVLKAAQEQGLSQSLGFPEIDERCRNFWPTCGGVPEIRLPDRAYEDLKTRGRGIPWKCWSGGSRKLVDQGGGRDLKKRLRGLKERGLVKRITGEGAVYLGFDGKRCQGEAAWCLTEAGKAYLDEHAGEYTAVLTFLESTIDRRQGKGDITIPAQTLLSAMHTTPDAVKITRDTSGVRKLIHHIEQKHPNAKDCFVINSRTVTFVPGRTVRER